MGKKKKKVKRNKNERDCSSDSENGSINLSVVTCPHLSKSICLNSLRKNVHPSTTVGVCQSCEPDSSTKQPPPTEIDPAVEEISVIWLCLQCGHQGCDRNSNEKHALHHFKTPHSDSHAVVLNTYFWTVWCYQCDDAIAVSCNKKLKECVDYVRRLAEFKSKMSSNNVIEKSSGDSKRQDGTQAKGKKTNSTVQTAVPRGLSNLGNTCFFNAVLQSLSQTHPFLTVLDKHSIKGANVELPGGDSIMDNDCPEKKTPEVIFLEPLKLEVSESGALTQSLALFMKDMTGKGKNGVISPGHVLGQVCKKSAQFKGAQQQDSHELLRHLLDGVRGEEIKRQKTAILKLFDAYGKMDSKSIKPEVLTKIKGYGKQVNHTIVDKVFGGQLISTVTCEECHMSSQVFEPFLDLSLPVTEEKPIRVILPKSMSKSIEDNYTSKKGTSKYLSKKAKQQQKKECRMAKNKQRDAENAEDDSSVSEILSLIEPDEKNPTMSLLKPVERNAANNSAETLTNGLDTSSCSVPEVSDADIEDNEDTESICTNSNNVGNELTEESVLETVSKDIDIVQFTQTCSRSQEDLKNGSEGEMNGICQRLSDNSICRFIDDEGNSDDSKEEEEKEGSPVAEKDEEEEVVEELANDVVKMTRSESRNQWIPQCYKTLSPRYQPASHECSIQSCLNQFTAPELLTGNNKFGCRNCTKMKYGTANRKKGDKNGLVYCNASKQMLIFSPPAILTLHLKRFQQVGYSLRKVNRHVEFPLLMDLSPFCSSVCLSLPNMKYNQKKVLYVLYAVVEQSGRLTGGHYVAYVKVRPEQPDCLSFLNAKKVGHEYIDKMRQGDTPGFGKEESNSEEDADSVIIPAGKWYCISDSHVSEVSASQVLKSQAYLLFYERIY